MTKLHAEVYYAVLRMRKVHQERELKDYQKALKFATPDMEAFDIILDIIEKIILNIKGCDEEINKVMKWRR